MPVSTSRSPLEPTTMLAVTWPPLTLLMAWAMPWRFMSALVTLTVSVEPDPKLRVRAPELLPTAALALENEEE